MIWIIFRIRAANSVFLFMNNHKKYTPNGEPKAIAIAKKRDN